MPTDAPNSQTPPRRPAVGAGMVCFKGDSVLMIKIGKPPHLGNWSIPGGHVEWGETTRAAAVRETFEETNVKAEIIDMIEVVDLFLPLSPEEGELTRHLVLIDYLGKWVSGEPLAGDDALHAEFVPLNDLENLGLWSETLRVIRRGAQMIGLASADPTD